MPAGQGGLPRGGRRVVSVAWRRVALQRLQPLQPLQPAHALPDHKLVLSFFKKLLVYFLEVHVFSSFLQESICSRATLD